MAVDFEVWAPLGADERIRQLWRATPDANPLPDGVEPLAPAGAPAKERLGELAIPVLVVTAKHDPPGFREIGPLVARAAPDARHVELDSDHYVTLREPELVARTLLEFLAEVQSRTLEPRRSRRRRARRRPRRSRGLRDGRRRSRRRRAAHPRRRDSPTRRERLRRRARAPGPSRVGTNRGDSECGPARRPAVRAGSSTRSSWFRDALRDGALISPLRSSYRSTPRLAARPSQPMARSSTPLYLAVDECDDGAGQRSGRARAAGSGSRSATAQQLRPVSYSSRRRCPHPSIASLPHIVVPAASGQRLRR